MTRILQETIGWGGKAGLPCSRSVGTSGVTQQRQANANDLQTPLKMQATQQVSGSHDGLGPRIDSRSETVRNQQGFFFFTGTVGEDLGR